ncbi:MAG TPA: energy transducer TonB [Candidatus Acidoferrales bacterium]|jgi:TonB family protein|nr:energy transducer TonB [Candidatus Acidoferrales bacterium]
MRNFAIAISLSICFLGSSFVARAADEKKARALIEKAAAMTDLRAPGAPPFRLRASVTTLVNGQNVSGTYTLSWASPALYREEFNFPGFTETDIVTDGKLWRKRSIAYRPLRMWQLATLLDIPGHLRTISAASRAIWEMKRNGASIQCLEWVACFDKRQGWPITLDGTSPGHGYSLEYSDFAKLGDKVFPRDLRYLEDEAVAVSVHVEEWANTPKFDSAVFLPPDGSDSRAWCANPKPAVVQRIPGNFSFGDTPVVFYGVIGTDGRLHDLALLQSTKQADPVAAQKIAEGAIYTPASCGVTPVEQEVSLTIHSTGLPEGGGNGYSVPKCEYCPSPEFSDAAVKAKVQGVVILHCVVTAEGRASGIVILKHMGVGLDEKAVQAVRRWRFKPATGPDGKPATVGVEIEVTFRLVP